VRELSQIIFHEHLLKHLVDVPPIDADVLGRAGGGEFLEDWQKSLIESSNSIMGFIDIRLSKEVDQLDEHILFLFLRQSEDQRECCNFISQLKKFPIILLPNNPIERID
jgi:hypothetical protein